jgi:hypothetical protein
MSAFSGHFVDVNKLVGFGSARQNATGETMHTVLSN